MPATSPPAHTFSLAYDARAQQLLACWRGHVTDNDLYAEYAELVASAEAHDYCRFWVLDIRARSWHSAAFRHWFSNEFAAAAHAALRRPLFLAYVVSPDQGRYINTPGVQTSQYNCLAYDLYTFFFDSEAAARDWLAHQQALNVDGQTSPTT